MKKYYYVYCSYEQWGRSYIGKRECSCLPEEDTLYFGSFADKSFNPTEKIILATFDTVKEVFEAEKALHVFFKVDENPDFANQHIQGFYSTYTHPKGSYWVNNGHENKFLKPGEEIPTGYQRGRMPDGYRTTTAYLEYKIKEVQERQKKFVEVATSPVVREKRKAKLKAINHQQGEKNSQFGTRFINNPLTGKNTRIKKDDPLPEGWVEGARFSDKTLEERNKIREAQAVSRRLKLELKIKSLKEAEKVLEEKSKLIELRDKERQARILVLQELYPIYLEGGFQAVIEAGYDKSQVNLVRQFAKYIPKFVPQNGKRRGEPKEQG